MISVSVGTIIFVTQYHYAENTGKDVSNLGKVSCRHRAKFSQNFKNHQFLPLLTLNQNLTNISSFSSLITTRPFLEVPPFDLETQMNMISKGSTPLMMVSAPGFDPSGQITALANSKKKQIVSMAMGSKEGFAQADKMISTGAKTGQWVILKNVHLAIEWLKVLEKKLGSIQVGSPENYRLFLCMEMNEKVSLRVFWLGFGD